MICRAMDAALAISGSDGACPAEVRTFVRLSAPDFAIGCRDNLSGLSVFCDAADHLTEATIHIGDLGRHACSQIR
jgi:hypothetical protein